MTKTKIFTDSVDFVLLTSLDDRINEFIKDKVVIDIKIIPFGHNMGDIMAMVIYSED